jgi:hypothetical protein
MHAEGMPLCFNRALPPRRTRWLLLQLQLLLLLAMVTPINTRTSHRFRGIHTKQLIQEVCHSTPRPDGLTNKTYQSQMATSS